MPKGVDDEEMVEDTIDDEIETETDEEVESDEVESEPSEETENDSETEESDDEAEDDNTEPEEDDDEVIVTIGDEETPPQQQEQDKAPDWVRELRKSHREMSRENRELKEKLKSIENPQPKRVEVGPKPKLEDFDYDTDEFEVALEKWHNSKRAADEEAKKAELAQEEANKAWQAKLDSYNEAKSKLKVKDFDDAEYSVQEKFDVTQQGIILQGSEDPALVIYALGKNEGKLAELAEIKDPVKFAFTVAKLETQLKVSNRKAPPPPEKTVKNGTGPKSGAVDSTLDRLRAEAQKTGDYSKVVAYRRKQSAKK